MKWLQCLRMYIELSADLSFNDRITEAHSEPCQTSKIEYLAEIVDA